MNTIAPGESQPRQPKLATLSPSAVSFVSSSVSTASVGSPDRLGSPSALSASQQADGDAGSPTAEAHCELSTSQNDGMELSADQKAPARYPSPPLPLPEGIPVSEIAGTSERGTIPAPTSGRPASAGNGLHRQSSAGLTRPYAASGGLPPAHLLPSHPGLGPYPAYGAAYPGLFHHSHPGGPLERAASPPPMFGGAASPPHPMLYPLPGSSPPGGMPAGFMSVPLNGGSPPHHAYHPAMYGNPYGSSPPPHPAYYIGGASPPIPGSPPPGMVYAFVPAGGHAPAGYSPPPAGGPPLQPEELLQRMAGLGVSQQQPGGSSQAGGRSEGRASARIARSHRAGGAYDPSAFVFSVEEAESGQGRTTLMIRNIPNKYSQAQMVSVLRNAGFEGSFDFFYLPVDFRNKCNLGYAFVNMTTSQATARLFREFHQKRWDELSSRKICEISFARVQGRPQLVEHFRAAKFPSDDQDLQPLVYTQRQGEVASAPVSIQRYIRLAEEVGEAEEAAQALGNGQQQADGGEATRQPTEELQPASSAHAASSGGQQPESCGA